MLPVANRHLPPPPLPVLQASGGPDYISTLGTETAQFGMDIPVMAQTMLMPTHMLHVSPQLVQSHPPHSLNHVYFHINSASSHYLGPKSAGLYGEGIAQVGVNDPVRDQTKICDVVAPAPRGSVFLKVRFQAHVLKGVLVKGVRLSHRSY